MSTVAACHHHDAAVVVAAARRCFLTMYLLMEISTRVVTVPLRRESSFREERTRDSPPGGVLSDLAESVGIGAEHSLNREGGVSSLSFY